MNWIAAIAVFLKIIFAWYLEKKEKDARRKRIFKEAKQGLKEGLHQRSTSKVFEAWDKVRRNRR